MRVLVGSDRRLLVGRRRIRRRGEVEQREPKRHTRDAVGVSGEGTARRAVAPAARERRGAGEDGPHTSPVKALVFAPSSVSDAAICGSCGGGGERGPATRGGDEAVGGRAGESNQTNATHGNIRKTTSAPARFAARMLALNALRRAGRSPPVTQTTVQHVETEEDAACSPPSPSSARPPSARPPKMASGQHMKVTLSCSETGSLCDASY